MYLLVHFAKIKGNLSLAESYREPAFDAMRAVISGEGDEFARNLTLSVFYRGASFLPFMRSDVAEVDDEMSIAESAARSLISSDLDKNVVAKDALYFVLESRMREALWVGDLDLAIARMKEAESLDGFDSRAKLQVGELLVKSGRVEEATSWFERAAQLGPPGSAICRFNAAMCWERLGNIEASLFWLRLAVEADPDGVSSWEAIHRISRKCNRTSLSDLAAQHLRTFQKNQGALVHVD